jgi:hypothetical protein
MQNHGVGLSGRTPSTELGRIGVYLKGVVVGDSSRKALPRHDCQIALSYSWMHRNPTVSLCCFNTVWLVRRRGNE